MYICPSIAECRGSQSHTVLTTLCSGVVHDINNSDMTGDDEICQLVNTITVLTSQI